MSGSSTVGFSKLLLDVTPYLALAADAAKDITSYELYGDALEDFEHDFAFIHHLLGRIHDDPDYIQAADDLVGEKYDFDLLNKVLDPAVPEQSLWEITTMVDDFTPEANIRRHASLLDLYKFTCFVTLEKARELPSQAVCFIRNSVPSNCWDSLASQFVDLLGANSRLRAGLISMIEELPARQLRHTGDRSSSTGGDHRTPLSQPTSSTDTEFELDFSHSRERLGTLYKVLHSTWPQHSNCGSDHPEHVLWNRCSLAQLRISATWKDAVNVSELYRLFLHREGRMYECEIEVNQNRKSVVCFDPGAYTVRDSAIPEKWVRICHPKCNPSIESRLYLYTNEEHILWDSEKKDLAFSASGDFKSFKLSQLVPTNELKYKEKLILTVLLARALLHLLGTQWLNSDWGMEDISVFCTRRLEDGRSSNDSQWKLNLREAYVQTHFRKREKGTDPDSVHRQPRILSLGIVIMQLMLGDRLEHLDRDLRAGKVSSNTAVRLARNLYKECELRFSRTWKVLKAMEKCKDLALFAKLSPDEGSIEVCRTYYANIVKPLEEALLQDENIEVSEIEASSKDGGFENSGDINALIKAEVQTTEREFERRSGLKRKHSTFEEGAEQSFSSRREAQQEHYAMAQFDTSPPLTEDKLNTSWRQEQEKLKQLFQYEEGRTEPYDDKNDFDKLIKVAIIDTGCDLNHKVFKQFCEGYRLKREGAKPHRFRRSGIWGCKDFVDGSRDLEDMQDTDFQDMKDTSPDNHGTFMTYLLLDTMPFLKVFVARVFEGSQTTDPETNNRVIKAINHAVEHWGVDIISMSFSLYGKPPDVTRSITDASRKGVLFFAAAGNALHAQAESLAFPASLEKVVCINAHDASSRGAEFTPLERRRRPNFAVPGKSLLGPDKEEDPKNNAMKYMSGTSCATPIAAAYAAMVLDYVKRHKETPGLTPEEKEMLLREGEENELQKVNNMKKIFFWCMVDSKTRKRGNYNAIKPWLLFNGSSTPEKILRHIIDAIELEELLW